MSDFDFTIPFENLPPGFAETLDHVPETPVPTRPAATILLLRDTEAGLETLMLRRTRRSGFVPGAYVFAGGRVDPADADEEVLTRATGLDPARTARRLALPETARPGAAAYVLAAVREAFEETGILVGNRTDGSPAPSAGEDAAIADLRDRLLANEVTFAEALDAMDARVDAAVVEYVAHWITPIQEPRRYDTRFFAAQISSERQVLLHPAEMTASRWLTPGQALELHGSGKLPMVFPTIRTLESLLDFESAASALAAFKERDIPAILPRLVKTPTGVGLEVP